MNATESKAVRALEDATKRIAADGRGDRKGGSLLDQYARALSAAGLLATDLHVRALEELKAWAKAPPEANEIEFRRRLMDIGREALAAEKPKVRFIATQSINSDGTPRGAWHVSDLGPFTLVPRPAIGPFSLEEAAAVAETLNKLYQEANNG